MDLKLLKKRGDIKSWELVELYLLRNFVVFEALHKTLVRNTIERTYILLPLCHCKVVLQVGVSVRLEVVIAGVVQIVVETQLAPEQCHELLFRSHDKIFKRRGSLASGTLRHLTLVRFHKRF